MAGLEDKYRSSFMFVDVGVGTRMDTKRDTKQVHYVGYCVHKASNQVKYGAADAIDGIDFFLSGHDHQPIDRPRGRLCYDAHNKKITQRSVETINCGAGMDYGGYGADGGYRPGSLKRYCLILDGTAKRIETKRVLYLRGRALSAFYNMDCMEGMKQFPDKYFELAIVDPPYGIGIGTQVGGKPFGSGGRGKFIPPKIYRGFDDTNPRQKIL